jgi:hypothetical protein
MDISVRKRGKNSRWVARASRAAFSPGVSGASLPDQVERVTIGAYYDDADDAGERSSLVVAFGVADDPAMIDILIAHLTSLRYRQRCLAAAPPDLAP